MTDTTFVDRQGTVNAAWLNDTNTKVYKDRINVKLAAYGAKGDGVTDDSAAIQLAINAVTSGGIVFFPPGIYLVNSGLSLSSKRGVVIEGSGQGAAGVTPGTVIKANAAITNLFLVQNCNQITCRDITLDGNLLATNILPLDVTAGNSTTLLNFYNVHCTRPAESGFSLKINPTLASAQISECGFYGCTFAADASTSAAINFRLNSTNALNLGFYNCNFWGRADRHVKITGGSARFYNVNFENSRNFDIEVGAGGTGGYFALYGGYAETGTNGQAGGTDSISIVSTNAENPITISGFVHTGIGSGGTGTTVSTTSNTQLVVVENCTSGILTCSSTKGMLVIGGVCTSFQGTAQQNILQLGSPLGGSSLGTSLPSLALTAGTFAQIRTAPTYGASVAINAALGNFFDITATNGTAFTVANPTNPIDGERISITIRNGSGGALGAVTWDTLYKLAAWTNPANTFSRTIDFKYNGTNWVELGRTTVDVPN